MLKAIKKSLTISSISPNPIFFHIFFIFVLSAIHLGFHFIDFLHLQTPQNFFDGALILTSMDAYHYAKGARTFLELLNASPRPAELLNALHTLHPLALLGGILAKCTSLSFALTWSSVLFSLSSGIVLYWLIYQILIKILHNSLWIAHITESQSRNLAPLALLAPFVSFLASLLAILSPSFYQRVGAGYFDTDMLLLTFPLLALLFLLRFLSVSRLSLKFLTLFALFGYLAIAWHNGIQNLLLLGFFSFLCLEFVNFLKTRRIAPKNVLLISVFFVLLTPSPFCLPALILLLVGIARFPRWLWIWLFFGIAYAASFGLFNPLFSQINAYLFGATQHAEAYIYASVVNGILETMPSSPQILMERSGGGGILGLSLLGFLIFGLSSAYPRFFLSYLRLVGLLKLDSKALFRNSWYLPKELFALFLFLLPFCLLGFGAVWLGMRFSFFLTPILALGIAFFIFSLFGILSRFLIPILLAFSVIAGVLIANLHYKIPQPILTHEEIRAFKNLDFNPQDIVFSWWDYGYALRYFTQAQVLLDGARHSGAVNFPIAKILLSPSPTLFYNFSLELAHAMQTLPKKQWNQIYEILSKDKGAEEYLKELEAESKSRTLADEAKVYWVLPLRILPLLANIQSFENVDLKSGKPLRLETFVFWDSVQNPPQATPQTILSLYDDFYTRLTIKSANAPLTQINFGQNSLLLSDYYLKSNIIQILLFANYPSKTTASGELVRVLQLD